MLTLSGRDYVYYLIQLIPALMLSFGLVGGLLLEGLTGAGRRAAALTLLSLALALAYNPALLVINGLRAARSPAQAEIAAYIQAHTQPDQTILVWGKDTTYVYFVAGRKAPSRQFYQAAINLPDYNNQYGAAAELYRDLQEHPPALFIIPGTAAQPGSCPLPTGEQPNSAGQVFAWICQHYTYTAHIEDFQVYQAR